MFVSLQKYLYICIKRYGNILLDNKNMYFMEYFIQERFTKISLYFSKIVSFNESHTVLRGFSRCIFLGTIKVFYGKHLWFKFSIMFLFGYYLDYYFFILNFFYSSKAINNQFKWQPNKYGKYMFYDIY